MLPIRKILCPTDFSEPACKAIVAAGELAEAFSSSVILLHVVHAIPVVDSPTGLSGFDVAGYQNELAAGAQRSLEERRDRIPESVETQLLVTHGDPAHEIVRVAKEEGVDLIVVSTHGATGWRHRIFGSVTDKVVHIAEIPVLTVHTAPAR